MSDRSSSNALTAARMRRYRQRLAERAEQAADITATRVARLCDRLEADDAAHVAWLIARVPPEVAGEVVDELLRRDQARAAGECGIRMLPTAGRSPDPRSRT